MTREHTDCNASQNSKDSNRPSGQSKRARIELIRGWLEVNGPFEKAPGEGPGLHSPQARHERQRGVQKRCFQSDLEHLRESRITRQRRSRGSVGPVRVSSSVYLSVCLSLSLSLSLCLGVAVGVCKFKSSDAVLVKI